MSNVGLPEDVVEAMLERALTHPARGRKSFVASIVVSGKHEYLGAFHTAEEAHEAYMNAAAEMNIKVKNNGISKVRSSGFMGVSKIPEYKKRRPLTGKYSTMDRSAMARVKEDDRGVVVNPTLQPHSWESKNRRTKARSDSVSGLMGAMQSGTGKWMSRIWTGERYKYLGYFHSAEEAHEAYARACSDNKDRQYENKKLYPSEKDGAFVYVIQYEEKYFKIGKSNDPVERLATVATCLPQSPRLLVAIYSSDPINLERNLHRKFSSKRVNGEWFHLDDSDVEFIMGISSR